ncbi:HD-GYP domain-containing protein [Metabacillus endolithicus]|uniref:HD-GYP domain-containing protein n=1 Tax=Metabacillus endolithicus TaxID=1535204 RepID=A0ABW5C3X8_9BACI
MIILEEAKDLFVKLMQKNSKEREWEMGYVLFQCLNMRDPRTGDHSLLVAYYSYKMGQILNLNKEQLFLAGLLHDIGKIEMSDEVLKTDKKLSKVERKQLKNHVLQGVFLLSEMEFDSNIIEFCSQHHERIDGSGYPLGIKHGKLSLIGRIANVTDVFSALTAKRKYNHDDSYSTLESLKLMEAQQAFDPGALSVLSMVVQSDSKIKQFA